MCITGGGVLRVGGRGWIDTSVRALMYVSRIRRSCRARQHHVCRPSDRCDHGVTPPVLPQPPWCDDPRTATP